jgi:hypothetical protein
MLIVKDCIISEDIAERRFRCDLAQCKGQCCVDGDCGAPLEEAEIAILEQILPEVEPYMTQEGLKVVHEEGVSTLDNAAEPCTPLVNNRECAYVAWGTDGTAYCAIEQAYRDGKIQFMKPISCHLYPIRVDEFGEFKALNYHQWDICRCAMAKGEPLYQYLKEPLIRRFGQDWYDELLEAIEYRYGKIN